MGSIARVFSAAFFLCLAACSKTEAPQVFVTEHGLGPDKWATAWLLTRHIDSGASLRVVAQGETLPAGVAFDTPSSDLRRTGDRTAFESTQIAYAVDDPAVLSLVRIIRDIEVNFWGADKTVEAQVVESAFRTLQKSYGRDGVSNDCYLAFFDRVYAGLSESQEKKVPLRQDSLALTCDVKALSTTTSIVQEMPIADILAAMHQASGLPLWMCGRSKNLPKAISRCLKHSPTRTGWRGGETTE